MTGRSRLSVMVPGSTSMSGILAGRCLITRSEYKKEAYCKGWAVQAIRRALAPATRKSGIGVIVALAKGSVVI